MALPDNGGDVEKVLRRLDEQHSKYKFMEYNFISKRRRLKSQIPNLTRSLNMVRKLQSQKLDMETEFLLSEQVYMKAVIPPTETVCLWLGANVMLEYSLKDAEDCLVSNISGATKFLEFVEHDLDFLRYVNKKYALSQIDKNINFLYVGIARK